MLLPPSIQGQHSPKLMLQHGECLSSIRDKWLSFRPAWLICAAAAQANSEVSALLGRIPSAVGYQPTLATDLGGLQERITTTKKGSITSVQVGLHPAPHLVY